MLRRVNELRRVNDRLYLECPYHEKDLVKELQLGARWDNTERRWYASSGTDLELLKPWIKQRIYLRCSTADEGTIENLGAKYDTTLFYFLFLFCLRPF